ncbi:PLP-dependent aminotransferase family protein [Nitrosococcus watsonii]|uniref:Transcriptional regulator, GntR family with aminotransferase domain n=1 Tax=Nitrosococcus watsoni (strain C-113) TaxID=105559 RepID=D8KBV0_NITWC|nr:PLP-dependent aminotransferase family protein [Nitrosococcus watsonii]ADJ27711.1 transcriptional regulator, GntR family with aminotransferase domain [Nitrosococcus watsonii C-113]
MQLPLKLERQSKQTLQNQLFEQIRSLILSGKLKPGTLMPATRSLSEQLGVSRNTVLLAYDRLIAEDYLQTQEAVGTYVNSYLPSDSLVLKAPTQPLMLPEKPQSKRHPVLFQGRAQRVANSQRSGLAIDFRVGRLDPHSFPTKTWRRLILRHLNASGSNLTEYRNPIGIVALREAVANHLGPARGIAVTPEQIIVVSGSQQALNIVARLLIAQGTRVVTECPCYQGAAYVFESYGAQLHPVPVDQYGLQVSKLPLAPASLAYVTPSHQYPMGSTLSLKRRVQLLDWAGQVGAYLIEDDYDSDFRHNGSPLTALAGLDPYDCVIYMGTVSKSIGAGLRLGYVLFPGELMEPAKTVKALLDNGNPWLDQAILADFISDGGYAKHLRQIRRMYLRRRDCLIAALKSHFGEVKLSGLEGGMHLVWHLPPNFPTAIEMQAIARKAGVGIYALESGGAYDYGHKEYSERILLLGYSSLAEAQICAGIAKVAAAFLKELGHPSTKPKLASQTN